jgi:hypothetical protein
LHFPDGRWFLRRASFRCRKRNQEESCASKHLPEVFFIDATADFLEKSRLALEGVRLALPECCRSHVDEVVTTPGREHVLAS